jgi:hypothetical protein
VPGLRRWLELYLGDGTVTLVEHFRARGLGGAFVDGDGALESSSVLGAGLRVGGALALEHEVDIISGDTLAERGAEAFRAHAHRFTVLISKSLDAEQRDVVEHILDEHRPAHTLYTMCSLDAGMRVGLGLHLELSSMVGAAAEWRTLQLDASLLGRNATLGQPRSGTSIGGGRVGKDSRVG